MTDWSSRLVPLARDLPPSGIRRFFDLAATMEDVISLGVGEPDFVTPWHIREAGLYALERGMTTYTANAGLLALRQAIARYLERRFTLRYAPEGELLVSVGGSEAIDLALRVLVRPGDRVLIPEPTYVAYTPLVRLAGGEPVHVPLRADEGFRLTASDLHQAVVASGARLLIWCNPNNPTGAVVDRRQLSALAEVAEQHDLAVISDEIYAEIVYGADYGSLAQVAEMRERTVLVGGFSKAFAMTGWRLGYAAGPEPVIRAMLKVHQYAMLCAPVMAQVAAVEAIERGLQDVAEMVDEYDRRRRFIVYALRDMGLACSDPGGAFYAFPDIRSTGLTSVQFAEDLLVHAKVAVVPGSVFGPSGEGFVRCSYAAAINQLERAMTRLRGFLQAGG